MSSSISPGPASNSSMSASVQHEQRATQGAKLADATAGKVAPNAHEQRATESGIAH